MDRIPGSSCLTRRKRSSKRTTSRSRSFMQCFSFTISKNTLNKLVALCAGKQASNMFERNRLLKYFRTLPDITEASCSKCYNDQVWANTIGGSDTGVRRERPSLITPWKDPNAGVIYRYRNTPPSCKATLARDSLTFVCAHKLKSPSNSSGTGVDNHSSSAGPIEGNAANPVAPSSQSSQPPVASKRPVKLKPCLKSPLTADERRFGRTSSPKKVNNVGFTKSCFGNESRTSNGRPVLRTNSELGIASPPKPFPCRLQRMRFDPRTSEPEIKPPDPTQQPPARLPPPFKTAPGSVEPYKIYPQYCQIWDPSLYIVKSIEPSDPTLQWLRENGLSCQATLRPNTMSLVKNSEDDTSIRNMQAFVDRNNGSKVNQAAVEETLVALRSLKQPQMKLVIPSRNGRPTIIKRSIQSKPSMTTSRRQSQMAKDANAAYERSQAKKGKNVAPLMERGNTKRRSTAVPVKLTRDEISRQSAGARGIDGLAVLPDKKVGKTSPLKQVVTANNGVLEGQDIRAAAKDENKRAPGGESISLITRRLNEEKAQTTKFSGSTKAASGRQEQSDGDSSTLVEHPLPAVETGPKITVAGTSKCESPEVPVAVEAEASDVESEKSDISWNPAWLIEEDRDDPEPQGC
ncbi:hypothetical protein BJ875DRAFT_538704 [Amylocarpus encephaloides]|uniref:Uncharacterized protein n=1 Tax=Amylocarpus encephaloides TaxID=45428 RepID=A0A9P7YT51_9HELO|nr:hypothetical protein BJ875DRAFT_538704 [Amylocarpus encephaloides]